MYPSSVRSTTASTAKTGLVFVAIFSLLLSLFAIVQPVIANHLPPDGPEVTPTAEEFPGGDPICPTGSVGIRFNNPAATNTQTVTLADGSVATVTIVSVAGNALTFTVEGGLAAIVKVKGGVSTPGVNDQNVYDYRGLPGGGIAHDDGLITPNQQGISHVDFCLVPVDASIIVYKTDQLGNDVEGAAFEVWDGDTLVAGPESTGADGIVCFDDLVLGKTYTVVETDAPDGWLPADPDNQSVTAAAGTCAERAGEDPDATFTNTRVGSLIVLKTDDNATTPTPLSGAEFTVDGVTQATGADGRTCFDGLVAGDLYDVTESAPPDGYEPADPATVEDVEAQAGTCAERAQDDPDVTFTNALIPGSLIVLKTDDDEESPMSLAGAEFTVDGVTQTTGDDGLTCFDGLVAGDAYDVTETTPPPGYQPADPATIEDVVAGSGTCADRAGDEPDVTFTNAPEELGSITINKEVACEICETFTPGFFFNRGENNAGTAFTNDWLPDNQVTIAGETFGDLEFDGTVYDSAVQEINAYLTADRSGDLDGETGLSAQGQLVRQSLALYLNVGLAGEDCLLADLVYTGDVVLPQWVDADENGEITVQELLDAAIAATDEAEMRAIAEAIDEINNSGDGDNAVVLDCPEGAEGTTGAGFMFELYGPDDDTVLADSGTTDENGVLVLDGNPDGSGLVLGEYLLVETDDDPNLECSIVDVTGVPEEAVTLNEDGTVTIVLTVESPDVTITVVNECVRGQEEVEFGDVEIRKDADDDPDEPFGFSATWDADGFMLTGGGDPELSGDLDAGTVVTVTETLTEAQALAGWSFEGIDCGDAAVDVSGSSVMITVVANQTITCTFTNELDREDEQPGGGGGGGDNETPREGTQGGNPVPDTAMSPSSTGSLPAALVALLMLAGLGAAGYAVRTEVARRR